MIDYIILSQENFNKIIINWDKCWESKDVNPFILLYQDDKDWFDILPFESQEAMEKFVADHTKN